MSFYYTTVRYLYYTDIYTNCDHLKQRTPIHSPYTWPVIFFESHSGTKKYCRYFYRDKLLTDTKQKGHSC